MDIDASMKDKEIWEYAETNALTIITKDSDFSNRILFKNPPPRVIHIKLGNMSMKKFQKTISANWETVKEMSGKHKLVTVYKDRIEGVD